MARYFFSSWTKDGVPGGSNVQITLPISTLDIDLVANYEEGFVLAVTSIPINVDFTLSKDGGTPQTLQTPFSQTLLGGQYTIVMPTSVGSYRFVKWNDENTSPTRTETLNKNSSAVAMYELVTTPFDFSISASPSSQPVTVGNSTSFAIIAALVAGTSQTVTLSVTGLPSNTTSGFSAVSGNPTFSSALNIQTSSNTPTGTYTLTITGTGNGLTRMATVTLQVNPVQVQRGTIQVKALIGTAEVTNASGDIKDPNNNIMDTFTVTPHSWDQAVVGVQYTVTCRLAGYADRVDTATVTTEGGSVSKSFQFGVLEAGFPWWVIIIGGGVAAAGVYLASRKKKG